MKLRAPARLIAVAFGLATGLATAHAQGLQDYTVTRWSSAEGAPTGHIRALVQDHDGFLWLGSDDGLVRFDGFRFERWHELRDDRLAGTHVRRLFVDSRGALWVGFVEGGISRVERTTVQNYGDGTDMPGANVRAFVEDGDGNMLAATQRGLFQFEGSRWTKLSGRHGLPDETVYSAHHDRSRSLYVGTHDSIYRRGARATAFERISGAAIDDNGGQAICVRPGGEVVLTDPIHGLRPVGGSEDRPITTEQGMGVALHCDANGTIWVGTAFAGLWRVTSRTSLSRETSVETGLLPGGAMSLIEDADRNVWVGTTSSIYRLTPRTGTSIVGVGIVATLATDNRSHVWAGTLDGLLRFDEMPDGWKATRKFLGGSRIRALHVDRTGRLWTSTSEGVVWIGANDSIVRPAWGTMLARTESIASDALGNLWLYDRGAGLVRVNEDRTERVELPADFRTSPADVPTSVALHADRENRVWVASASGIAMRAASGIFQRVASDDLGAKGYRAIHDDDRGTIWFAGPAGIGRYEHGRFEHIRITLSYPGRSVQTITSDAAGRLWLGIDSGGVRIERADFERAARTGDRTLSEGFEAFDGFPAAVRVIGDRASIRAPDGDMWFVTDEGIRTVPPPAGVARHHVRSRVVGALADGEKLTAARPATMTAGTARVQVEYGALNLTAPQRVRFRYRLEQFDNEWVYAGARRTAYYTHLSPGTYRFHVSASLEGSSWTGPAESWEFTVQPLVYQTTWFPFTVALALGGIAAGAWYLRVAQVQERFAVMLAERARVSREIHDTLLQSLVGIAMQCQALAEDDEPSGLRGRLLRLRRQVDDHIREARESIWNLRSPVLEQLTLSQALQRSGDTAVEGTPIAFALETVGRPRPCPPAVEQQILRVGQEAIVNAVRHGRPTRVTAYLCFAPGSIALRMVDDGCGFDVEHVLSAPGHCGLISMRERTESVGGRFAIVSRAAGGTELEATVPLAPITVGA